MKTLLILVALLLVGEAMYKGKRTRRKEFVQSFVHFGTAHHFLCGGVLISWNHVLTAAHCEVGPGFVAYLGSSVRHSLSDTALVLTVRREYHPHGYDFALIELSGAGREKLERAGLVPMPIDWTGRLARQGRGMIILGFGGIRARAEGRLANSLRVVGVAKLPTATCLRRHFYTSGGSTSLCIAARGWHSSTACKGDSGGPVVAWDRDLQQLSVVAIIIATSAGPRDWSCKPGSTILATEIRPFHRWLIRRIGDASAIR